MSWRGLLIALAALLFATPALAREEIKLFNVTIEVEQDGDFIVTEALDVVAEGNQINRGIFRDLPRYYRLDGDTLRYEYDVLSVERDGERERYDTETDDNAFRIRIGDPDVFIDHGLHHYEIRYLVKNQVRYFDDHDEVYWNVTGNYWLFPINEARATVILPPGANVTDESGYTGRMGAVERAYRYSSQGNRHTFITTRDLSVGEGLTISLSFDKGVIDPPSAADQRGVWWQRYGPLAILIGSLGGLFFFLYRGFQRVGRDPLKGPVFPRYEAPEGYSPAAVHHIYHRGLSGHRALIATLMNLAVKGRITIDASDKKKTELTRAGGELSTAGLAPEDLTLETNIFSGQRSKTLGEKYDSGFTAAYASFREKLSKRYGGDYFRWNAGYTVFAALLSFVIIIYVLTTTINWTIWHGLALIALAALNLLFMYLMPAPTEKGQRVRTEIEGLKLYMEKAEKLQLNAVQPSADQPPPMTKDRYERFLPYAVALGVEDPWTKHFERVLPEEAAHYSPTWTNMGSSRSMHGLTSAIVANMATGVASAMPQSSSSSGSGGGGSSGGGGGGGGGGGW